VKVIYRLALSREPDRKELETNVAFLKKQRAYEAARKPEAGDDGAILSALTDLAHVMLNLNEFLYIG
jgi:hypothetical protein